MLTGLKKHTKKPPFPVVYKLERAGGEKQPLLRLFLTTGEVWLLSNKRQRRERN